MTHIPEQPKKTAGSSPSSPGVSMEVVRRRFLGAGLAVPVVATFAGRPAWASACSESGQMSGNMSAEPCVGNQGCTPGFWKNAPNHVWHNKYTPDSHFHTVFAHSGSQFALAPGGLPIFDGTLRQVAAKATQPLLPPNWTGGDGNFRTFGAHTVAALQNAATDVDYFFTVQDVFVKFAEAITLAWAATTGSMAKDFINDYKGTFATYNERGCPVDMHGNFTS